MHARIAEFVAALHDAQKSEHEHDHHHGYNEPEDTAHFIIPLQAGSEGSQSIINKHAYGLFRLDKHGRVRLRRPFLGELSFLA